MSFKVEMNHPGSQALTTRPSGNMKAGGRNKRVCS